MKHVGSQQVYLFPVDWREDSIKTRIETSGDIAEVHIPVTIEEKIPLKQGLKLFCRKPRSNSRNDWREDSIKTRIETHTANIPDSTALIEEKIPLKQGLKHMWSLPNLKYHFIEEKIPLKQGLKPSRCILGSVNIADWREDSIKTRIETDQRGWNIFQ